MINTDQLLHYDCGFTVSKLQAIETRINIANLLT